jgi:superfamily II DNA or RNA helicase
MNYEWAYSSIHKTNCKIIEEMTLWGQTVCRVWLPNQDIVIRVAKSTLRPIESNLKADSEIHRISYLVCAARVADLLEGHADENDQILLAPMESNVIPLPHQIRALTRAVSGDQVRYLLADEVGLGKTIEAGLIIRELKLRGLIKRILVVSPKGIATQWVSEMQNHFNENFHLIMGDDISTLQRLSNEMDQHHSPWTVFDQVIVSLDSVKPLERRRGWSDERIAEYNRYRYEELITAEWDLIIVDEAHRLGGSTDQVARYKLGRGLADAAPYVLFLSATPHQGKSDAFYRIMNLIDAASFPDIESVSQKTVAPFVIRTEKRKALDGDGKALFKPRRTQTVSVVWHEQHHLQRMLYDAVTDYVREGYNQAILEKKPHIGFLLILMQRLVVSSTRAIRTTLERRKAFLENDLQSTNDRLDQLETTNGDSELIYDYDLDGQEQLDQLLASKIAGLQMERTHIQVLLETARRCELAGPDVKAEALLDWIFTLQNEENELDLKVLIFTEFVPTQLMLTEFLENHGISVVQLNGSMDMDQRRIVQQNFRDKVRVLISTDAGGEGLNLQFCHVVFNYDLPWNPMRLEQRIGRVDRIGQSKIVQAINFQFQDSVEFRVREVLEQKLSTILQEFGIDKTGDVLDSAQAGELFENAFTNAIVHPDQIEKTVEETVQQIRNELEAIKETSPLYGLSEQPDTQTAEQLRNHPLPYWVEKMTTHYIQAHGGDAIRKRSWWDLTWPDGQLMRKCVFHSRDQQRLSDVNLINLENKKVREISVNIPQITAGQLIPKVFLIGLPAGLSGYWGLFEVDLQAGLHKTSNLLRIPVMRRRFFSIFVNDEGRLFLPSARTIWDKLQITSPDSNGYVSYDESAMKFEQMMSVAEQAGQDHFEALNQVHQHSIEREQYRGEKAFIFRRKSIEKIGLPEVRRFRSGKCDRDERDWLNELESAKQIVPDIRPILILRIESER